MRTVRSLTFALFCLVLLATIVMPAVRAQRADSVERKARDLRTMAQQKINPRVLAAIYHRRGDAKGKATPAWAARVEVDRHGRALIDVRAHVRPELEKKFKALGGIVLSKSQTYDSIVGLLPLQSVERLAADRTVRAIEPGPYAE
ncbi:MAG TPA: hypothetical protein VFK57_06945 [Vicinamibacterales bacterium]|nr:hypothetical protein [Vicinamibacterales bacterium]